MGGEIKKLSQKFNCPKGVKPERQVPFVVNTYHLPGASLPGFKQE